MTQGQFDGVKFSPVPPVGAAGIKAYPGFYSIRKFDSREQDSRKPENDIYLITGFKTKSFFIFLPKNKTYPNTDFKLS